MTDRTTSPTVDAPAIVGVFDDLDAARSGMQALRNQGIDPVHISLIGPRVGEEEAREIQRDLENNEGRELASRVLKGGAAGGTLGTLAGGLAVLTIPGLGPSIVGGALIAAASGASAAVAGGASAVATTEDSWDESWERTFADVGADDVLVVVHGREEQLLDDAGIALQGADAREVRRTEAGERP